MSAAKERREAMERARHMLQTEGVVAAVEALVSVCRDPKAPAPAKSTAGTSLLRASGFFDRAANEPDKELHEMTFEELVQHSARLECDRDALLSEMTENAEETAFD